MIQTPYSGGVRLGDDHHFVVDPLGKQYVGEPGPDVDRAWNNLLRGLSCPLLPCLFTCSVSVIRILMTTGLNIDLRPDEITSPVNTFQWPESGNYFTGLEVYHSLHCLVYPLPFLPSFLP